MLERNNTVGYYTIAKRSTSAYLRSEYSYMYFYEIKRKYI